MSDKKKVKDVIINQLENFNIKNIYGYPGDTILKFISELKDSPITLYTTKHEGAAGLMASAEAKLQEKLAVCIAHSGPGSANIINGIADASKDKAPLLLISGQVQTYNIGTNYKQYIRQQQLTDPLTVFSGILTHPETVIDLLYKAMVKALTKGGVSHLIIPMDMWDKNTNARPRQYPEHLNYRNKPDTNIIEQAAEKINKAEKPVILYGRGVKNAQKELKKLGEKIQAPLINSLPAAGMINHDYYLSLGGLGQAGSQQASEIINQSDLIIIAGSCWWPVDFTPRKPKIIQLDLVKENIGSTHPVDTGIPGDIKLTLTSLLDMISPQENTEWADQIKRLHQDWLNNQDKEIKESEGYPLSPGRVINNISENIERDEIITLDSGDSVIWFGKYFKNTCKDLLISGSWRTMGFSIPAALAAKINQPDHPVTAITGDGGFCMVMAELLTATRYELPVRIIVINNAALAMEKNKMKSADLKIEEVDLNNPDIVKLAEACNLKAYRVKSINNLQEILQKTKNPDKAVVIDIPTADTMPPDTKL